MNQKRPLFWMLAISQFVWCLPQCGVAAGTGVEHTYSVWAGSVLVFIAVIFLMLLWYVIVLRSRLKSRSIRLNSQDSKWLNALELHDEPMYLVDLQDNILRGNGAFYEKIGKTPLQANGTNVAQYFHPRGEEKPCPICQARLEQRNAVLILEADDPRNHSDQAMEIRVRVVHDERGKPVAILQHLRDLTHHREIEQQLRKSEEKFRTLLESTPDPLVISSREGKIVLVNKQCERVFGYRAEELIGQQIEILLPDAMHEQHVKHRGTYSQGPKIRPLDKGDGLVVRHKDGKIIPVEISLSPWMSGDELLINSTIRDVTERKQKEHDLKRLASFLRLSPTPVFEMDATAKVTFFNPKAEELFPELKKSDPFHPLLEGIHSLANEARQTDKAMTRLVGLKGCIYEQQVNYIAEVNMYHIYLWDVTATQKMTEKIIYQANHDGLTGLINRIEFEQRIQQAIHEAQLEDKTHAFCFIDLDRFKIINDQCGHPAGDEFLKQLSEILKSKIRDSDTLARLGGDEFGLLLTGCNLNRAKTIAEDLRQAITDYRFLCERKSYSVGASIGLVMLTPQSGALKQVMQAADSACYVAKEKGRDRVHIYRPDDKTLAQHSEYLEWAHRILEALENNRFVLYAQTIHSLQDEQDVLQEVLMRMVDKDGEIIVPGAFIPAAERYHLMPAVDQWAIKHVFEAIQQGWSVPTMCTINLSGESISAPEMLGYVIEKFEEYDIEAEKICFEITETAMASNLSQAKRFISSLKGIGCLFALDDFGSGVSSFAYLQSLPVDILKIDGKLVRGMEFSKVNEVMVKAINEIGHTMNMKTVAESVENKVVVEKLKAIGVDYAQGYYYSKPKPIHE